MVKTVIKNLYHWSEMITGTHGKLLHKSSDWIERYHSHAGGECPFVLPKEQYGGLNLGGLILGNGVKHQDHCSLVISLYVLPVGAVFIFHEVLLEGGLFGNFLFGLSNYNSIWRTAILYDEFTSVGDHVDCGSSEDEKSLFQDTESSTKRLRLWDKMAICFSGGTSFPALWNYCAVELDLNYGFVHLATVLELYRNGILEESKSVSISENLLDNLWDGLYKIQQGVTSNEYICASTTQCSGWRARKLKAWPESVSSFEGGTICHRKIVVVVIFDEKNFIWLIAWRS
ncbi:OLC1v1025776C1 [Oldenlandia corymbosa var. corymbosa]|uniref:OLC1v1025776C1 n=1 Tax=Oldenlandia corymbosa var. corymbosa TaxID=529605 RepID=A0AAV1C5H4_OLDCO|nr:OLC1v1025776C1 [Oldenlandia corymbosa var. corymbosa]